MSAAVNLTHTTLEVGLYGYSKMSSPNGFATIITGPKYQIRQIATDKLPTNLQGTAGGFEVVKADSEFCFIKTTEEGRFQKINKLPFVQLHLKQQT